jgi:hypothetical protein
MAKKQTFGDKLKKGKGVDKQIVKVIKGFQSANGSTKYMEEYIKVEDMNEVTKIDIK